MPTTNRLCRYIVRGTIKISIGMIQKCILRRIKEVEIFFPKLIFADSGDLGKKLLPNVFEGRGVIFRRVDEWERNPFLIVLTPKGLFSCPIVVGIPKKTQEQNQEGLIVTCRHMASRRLTLRNNEDFDQLNSYPDWAQRRSEHYLWVKYAKQAMDYIDELVEKNKPS